MTLRDLLDTDVYIVYERFNDDSYILEDLVEINASAILDRDAKDFTLFDADFNLVHHADFEQEEQEEQENDGE